MIIIFGFVILLIIASLFYLENLGKIPKNIPIIFISVLIICAPFIYLARSRSDKIENFANSESLNIFFTNESKSKIDAECEGCPGVCDDTKKDYDKDLLPALEKIDNPVQSRLKERTILPVNTTIYSGSSQQGAGFIVTLTAPEKTYKNAKTVRYIDNGFYMVPLTIAELSTFAAAKYPANIQIMGNIIQLELYSSGFSRRLIPELENIKPDSYIIFGTCGDNMEGILKAPPKDLVTLSSLYGFELINQIQTGDSYAGIIYKRDNTSYTNITQEISPAKTTSAVLINNFSLLKAGKSMEIISKGREFETKYNSDLVQSSNLPFVQFEFVYIKPDVLGKNLFLVFSAENNSTFVFVSERPEEEKYTLYTRTPEEESSNPVKTFLNQRQPQKWVFEPVFNSDFNDMFYIVTFNEPKYYLEVETTDNKPVLKTALYKAGAGQYWRVVPTKDNPNVYTIQNEKTKLYIGYTQSGGYLYNDNGNVFLTDTKGYSWKFIPSLNKKPYIKNKEERKLPYQDWTSPGDFPNTLFPYYKLQGVIDGKTVDMTTYGRSAWDAYYTPIWNGQWIYYGTVATYGQNNALDKTKFLEININEEGEGMVTDTYNNLKIPVRNAGSNYLFGFIDSGVFKGYMAAFQFLPLPLEYKNPESSYPVKMRYLVFNNSNIYNLSSGDTNNLNAYSTKFDGKKPAITNFLEMTGNPTYFNMSRGDGIPFPIR